MEEAPVCEPLGLSERNREGLRKGAGLDEVLANARGTEGE